MIRILLTLLLFLHAGLAVAANPADTIERIKPSIVVIGTVQKTRNPMFQFRGTGFVVGDGSLVATNAHVLPEKIDHANNEVLVVGLPATRGVMVPRAAKLLHLDESHDLAVLSMTGDKLKPMKLGDAARVREGETYFFTGYPLGEGLGLFPATHRALVAAIAPVSLPLPNARQLDPKVVKRLRAEAFPIFQLDATAYPGNSGSPLFNPDNGEVIGIVNMVFVKGTKEAAITAPSGIAYAIPVYFLQKLLGEEISR